MRGFRQDETTFDGLRGNPFEGFSIPQLFNIERVEVLKGPSATMNGGGEPDRIHGALWVKQGALWVKQMLSGLSLSSIILGCSYNLLYVLSLSLSLSLSLVCYGLQLLSLL